MISVGFHFRKCGCKSKALTKESLTDFSLEFVTICIDYIGEALSIVLQAADHGCPMGRIRIVNVF